MSTHILCFYGELDIIISELVPCNPPLQGPCIDSNRTLYMLFHSWEANRTLDILKITVADRRVTFFLLFLKKKKINLKVQHFKS